MNNIIRWCSKKDNMKIIIMVGLAFVLILVLKQRFSSEKDLSMSASAVSAYETPLKHGIHTVKSDFTKTNLREAPSTVKYAHLKPPPFLSRDVFSFRQTKAGSNRESDRIILEDLELNATIIDEQGSLAVIGDEVLGIGEFVKGLEVTDIQHDEVTVSGDEKKYILRIIKE